LYYAPGGSVCLKAVLNNYNDYNPDEKTITERRGSPPSRVLERCENVNKDFFQALVERTPPFLLAAAVWRPEFSPAIEELSDGRLADLGYSPHRTACIRAALHIANDDWEAAHRIVQESDDADGYLLHAILHRREGDYDNARYWFSRAGEHPVYERLYSGAKDVWPGILQWGRWRPELFVDMAQEADGTGRLYAEAVEIQAVELRSVLHYLLDRTRM
jgi:hypothetical protein